MQKSPWLSLQTLVAVIDYIFYQFMFAVAGGEIGVRIGGGIWIEH